MQAAIDRERELLEQIMPESSESPDLVEGVSKNDDEKYNHRHYFNDGNRIAYDAKNDSIKQGLNKDYYKDGGYICPSYVTYMKPRRAKTSAGLWKIIVNLRERYRGLDYKQTVRVEQCM
jgi:hypothetical protein